MIEQQYRVVMNEQARTIERLKKQNADLANRIAELESMNNTKEEKQ